MYATEILAVDLALDENGLLIHPDDWNESIALILAQQNGIENLTADHWKVIHDLRKHYNRFGVAPSMYSVCRRNKESANWVHILFHTCLNAWRVSGLPDPGEEAKSYLSDM